MLNATYFSRSLILAPWKVELSTARPPPEGISKQPVSPIHVQSALVIKEVNGAESLPSSSLYSGARKGIKTDYILGVCVGIEIGQRAWMLEMKISQTQNK